MIAKVIVWDDTRDAAIARAERALRELEVEGIPTTRELALDVLGSPEFRSGDYSTSTLTELEGRLPSLVRHEPADERKAARRQALFLLYQWDLTGQELASLFEGEPDDFAFALAEAVAARAEALDPRISAASPDWPADRLGTLERNILRIGVYELEEETVPREVAINEAVVLAKRYATEDAARLVNGILARVARRRVSERAQVAGEPVSPAPPDEPPRSARQPMRRLDDALARGGADELNAREELERLAAADDVDGDAAVDLIAELAELARQIEAELTRARNLADADG